MSQSRSGSGLSFFLFVGTFVCGLFGWTFLNTVGQAQRDDVLAIPEVTGASIDDKMWAPGAAVKLSARLADDHDEVMPGTGMIIAERDTITTTSEQDDYRVKERDLAASRLPALRIVALDGTSLRVAEGARVLGGATSWEGPRQEGAWREVFRGFRNGDAVGLKGVVGVPDDGVPVLTAVWMVSGAVEDLDTFYDGSIEQWEPIGRWLSLASVVCGVLWMLTLISALLKARRREA